VIHAVYDITSCAVPDPGPAALTAAMRDTVHRLGCTVLGELPVLFQPHGATCVLVLAESHLTVSTWPEHQLAHIDLFTCRADIDPEQAITPILTTLGAGRVHGQRVHRVGATQSRTRHVTTAASAGRSPGLASSLHGI
jgi:S-adenosylmethionine decarboxylase